MLLFDKDLWTKDKISIDKNFGYNDSSSIILMIEMMSDLVNLNLEANALQLKDRIKHEVKIIRSFYYIKILMKFKIFGII